MNRQTTPALLVAAPPWYRQFWPCFVIALPASVVVAAFITLAIAIRHADEIVRDDYYKDGLAINQRLDREKLAHTMNLQAALSWQPDAGEIHVQVAKRIEDPYLLLRWLHPLKRQFDRDIVLIRRDDTKTESTFYDGQVDASPERRFYLQLENMTTDSSTAWRLHGEIITAPNTAVATRTALLP